MSRTIPMESHAPHPSDGRVRVDGKFFRLGSSKFHPRGVTYGPFAPDSSGCHFGTPAQARNDLQQIASLNANLVRIYHVPPRWFLDLATELDIRVMVDVPWNQHRCFLDNVEDRRNAIHAVRTAAQAVSGHPAVFAISVVNEIPADIVRWSGSDAVAAFIDELVSAVRQVDPHILCTFSNFPPTEFLRPQTIDFLCFNLYLHQQRAFESYLARLQMLADTKPLLLGETGIDTRGEGTDKQAEILGWQIEVAFRSGLAGIIVYSFTDEWWRDDRLVTEWTFGLTLANRQPKPAWEIVRQQFAIAPRFPLARYPRVSVVVASYNGAPTLVACLKSLQKLNYPDYEVILVDDGSTDDTQELAALVSHVRTLRHPVNRGLSVARNTGIDAATGEIVAFTDSDCRADEDWLYYIVGDLLNSRFCGIGGHNFLPPDDSCVAAAVMVSPGGPAHVMIDNRHAEHIPGCNMAFYRWALLEIGGFDPIYRQAGDDVDVCWRLQQRGYRLGFSPGGFVWHYRRNTIRAYLKQQAGYGRAEALLERRHPENFNTFGGSIWQGRIYAPGRIGVETRRPVIYHGIFGSAYFQSIYAPPPDLTLVAVTSLEYYFLISLPLLILGAVVRFLTPLGLVSLAIPPAFCIAAAWQADLAPGKRRWWSRPLIALLFLLQPVIRGWARHRHSWRGQNPPDSARSTLASEGLPETALGLRQYWVEKGVDRMAFLGRLQAALDTAGWANRPDAGWSGFDLELHGSRWARLELTSAVEYHTGGRAAFCCRLRTRRTFFSSALLWILSGMLLLLIGVVGGPWTWLAVLTVPFLFAFIKYQELMLQRAAAGFIDQVAEKCGWIRIPNSSIPEE